MNEMTSMQLILHSGNARSLSMEAIQAAKSGSIEEAKKMIEEANTSLNEAHHTQTELIQAEARGEKNEFSILLVHAQDHLMTSMVVRDMANEFIELYEKINT